MSRKKTHEEYVVELSIKNPTVEVVDKYIDAKTKIKHHCLIHDVYWDALPGNVLSGKGCHECMKDKNRNKFVKTNEKYVLQVQHINPDIVVLEKYVDSKTPILHLCKKHNIEWKAIPSNILKGYGCSECKKEKIINFNLKCHEQYINELLKINGNIEVIGNYIDCKTPILHYCNEHNKYWMASPTNVLNGKGCPKCRSKKISDALKKEHENYVLELSKINPQIEVIEKYVNCRTSIVHHCLIHDFYWNATPSSILKGCGCPKCLSEKIRDRFNFTHEEYVQALKRSNDNIIVVEQYINMKTPILHKCLIHNHEWKTTPSSTLQGCGCPKCKSEKLSAQHLKSHQQYIEELKEINSNIIVIEEYNGANTPILHKCLIDNNEWYSTPSNILYGYGCPQCNESKGEKQIRLLLDKYNIKYETQKSFKDCIDIKTLPFDFYLAEHNLCIEYDGLQHFEPVEHFGGLESFEITKKHDEIKSSYCKENGISLLRIPYFKNVEEELNNFLFI